MSGWFAEPGSEVSMAERLGSVLSCNSLDEASSGASARAAQFGAERIAAETAALYTSVVTDYKHTL